MLQAYQPATMLQPALYLTHKEQVTAKLLQ